MLFLRSLIPVLLNAGCSVASPARATATDSGPHSWQWANASGHGRPWQWAGPKTNASYWFGEFESTLATMQNTYWNGTYWPSTIQWTGAFFDTLLAASDRSFTSVLERHDNDRPESSVNSLRSEIEKYYSEIEAYYGGEDTDQIFDAAYDDAQWVVLEWLEAIKFIRQYDEYASSALGEDDLARFAHRAHVFYNIVQDKFDTSTCGGGLTWNPTLAVYKNAITNELFLSSSIAMYLYFPGDDDTDPYPSPDYANATNTTLPALPALAAHDPLLLDNAQREYEWFGSQPFANAQGLIIDGFHVSNNQTTCDQPDPMVYTYNQGVLLSGLRGLWEATGSTSYLTDGYAYIDTVINATGWHARSRDQASDWAGLGRNGIMEDYCDAPANCSQDAQVFKGIYFHHLDLFCEALPTRTPLVAGLTKLADAGLANEHSRRCASYTQWILHNAYAALSTRNETEIIGGWWGASYVNKTQGPWPEYAAATPDGSVDVWNEPGVLSQSPWKCEGWHCGGRGKARSGSGYSRSMAEVYRRRRRDVNDEGRGRTVETQASGLGVVMAASDFLMRRGTS